MGTVMVVSSLSDSTTYAAKFLGFYRFVSDYKIVFIYLQEIYSHNIKPHVKASDESMASW